jgi:hypothetical protein
MASPQPYNAGHFAYQWIDDDGASKSTHPVKEREDATPESGPQGTTNPELLRSLDMASTMYRILRSSW